MPEVEPRWKEPKQPKDIPKQVREEVRDRSFGLCEVRGPVCTGRATDMHHVTRRAQKRLHTAENLLHICHADHMHIHAHVAWAKRQGYLT